jgi:hyperosmotically inducible protein
MMLTRNTLAIMALAWALVGQLLPAADRAVDVSLMRNIQRAVESTVDFTVFDDVEIDVDDERVVVLTGHVTAQTKRIDIARRVSTMNRVVGVQNDLAVPPASRLDTELRYLVARSIYGSSTFWHYAARRNSPIRIVVERGHVTLTGLVDSEADRPIAAAPAFIQCPVAIAHQRPETIQ